MKTLIVFAILTFSISASAQGMHSTPQNNTFVGVASIPNGGSPQFSTDVDSTRNDAEASASAARLAADANQSNERSYQMGGEWTPTPEAAPASAGRTSSREISDLAAKFRKIREAREKAAKAAKQ